MTHRDVMGREVGGGSCLGTHVRIKDFKIKKKLKNKKESKKRNKIKNKRLNFIITLKILVETQ